MCLTFLFHVLTGRLFSQRKASVQQPRHSIWITGAFRTPTTFCGPRARRIFHAIDPTWYEKRLGRDPPGCLGLERCKGGGGKKVGVCVCVCVWVIFFLAPFVFPVMVDKRIMRFFEENLGWSWNLWRKTCQEWKNDIWIKCHYYPQPVPYFTHWQ